MFSGGNPLFFFFSDDDEGVEKEEKKKKKREEEVGGGGCIGGPGASRTVQLQTVGALSPKMCVLGSGPEEEDYFFEGAPPEMGWLHIHTHTNCWVRQGERRRKKRRRRRRRERKKRKAGDQYIHADFTRF